MAEKYRALIKERMPVVVADHDEQGHFYLSPTTHGRYKSTTYYTGAIKDPSLANYKMNRALRHVAEALTAHPKFEWTEESIADLVKKSADAPQTDFESAGAFGTQAHDWRYAWFRDWIASGQTSLTAGQIDAHPLPDTEDLEVISACRAIKKFLKDTGYIPVACELSLVDDKLELGGQADDLGVMPNPVRVAVQDADPNLYGGYRIKHDPYLLFMDLKTSNQGKKPAYAYQVRGFYQPMLRKTFRIRPKKTVILHTSKEDGTYQIIDLTHMAFIEAQAPLLVELSRSWDEVRDAFKPKPIVV